MASKAATARHYDRLARAYSELYGPEQLRKHSVALGLLEVGEGDAVLDAGCGDGSLMARLVGRCSLAVGVDSSREMLRVARGRVGRGAALVLADVERLPFRGGCFDAAFLITVLQDLPSPGEGLREVARVLRGGGLCVATWLKKAPLGGGLEGLLRGAGLRPIRLLDLEGVQDVVSLSVKEGLEPRAYLRRIRNVRRGLELRSRIIRALGAGGMTVGELARAVGRSYSSALRQLKNMEREGLVERLGGRPTKWRLTGRGQACIEDYLAPSSAGPQVPR
ncbi:MAG: methyltransferase domain-containing protein [Candidatus Nezhaarchaeales archaeon]